MPAPLPTTATDDRLGRLRRTLRNPSVPALALIVFLVLLVPLAVGGTFAVKRGMAGWDTLQARRRTPPIASAPGTWINPWLRDQAARMMNATGPLQWRGVSFQSGPCHPNNLSLLPRDKWSDAIITSCGRLDDIQLSYDADCAATDACVIPHDAKAELQGVIDYLITEFADSGLVLPYTTEEQSQ